MFICSSHVTQPPPSSSHDISSSLHRAHSTIITDSPLLNLNSNSDHILCRDHHLLIYKYPVLYSIFLGRGFSPRHQFLPHFFSPSIFLWRPCSSPSCLPLVTHSLCSLASVYREPPCAFFSSPLCFFSSAPDLTAHGNKHSPLFLLSSFQNYLSPYSSSVLVLKILRQLLCPISITTVSPLLTETPKLHLQSN